MGLPLTSDPPSAALPLDPAGDSAAHSSPCTFSVAPPAELRFELSSEDSVSTFFGCFFAFEADDCGRLVG